MNDLTATEAMQQQSIQRTLPINWTQKIIRELTLRWGREFIGPYGIYAGVPDEAIVGIFSKELASLQHRPEAIAWGIENLPERAMNVIQFRQHCRNAPRTEAPMLPSPPPNPAKLREAMSKIVSVLAAPKDDRKDWARRIIARAEAGEKVSPTSLGMARAALRLHLTTTTEEE